jgi:hypothetical protein
MNELKKVSISIPVNRIVQSVLIGSDKGTSVAGLSTPPQIKNNISVSGPVSALR